MPAMAMESPHVPAPAPSAAPVARHPRSPRLGLSLRLFLAVLGTGIAVAALVSSITLWSFEREFLGYLNEVAVRRMDFVGPRLEQAHRRNGNWDFLRVHPRVWFGVLRPVPGEELPADVAPDPGQPLLSDLTGAIPRLGLLDAQGQWVAGYRQQAPGQLRRALNVDGRVVGWLTLAPFQSVAEGGEQRFVQGLLRASALSATVAIALAAAVAWWTSRRLLAPLRRVAAATHQLAAGRYDIRVVHDSPDEVGQLARDFNHLALALQRAEGLRHDFLADVSHELRTPVAVLRGEIEALQDGIRPLNADALASLQAEVQRLATLVDDLYELARSDAGALSYRYAPVALGPLLAQRVQRQQHRFAQQGLTLTLDAMTADAEHATVQADEGRLQQLLDNLLANSLRYTDAPGQVRLALTSTDTGLTLTVQDSAPGVPPYLLPRLFERLFRVETSRSRDSGGAGLGLAICRNIVLAHGGRIEAEASPLGGVTVRVNLPRHRDNSGA